MYLTIKHLHTSYQHEHNFNNFNNFAECITTTSTWRHGVALGHTVWAWQPVGYTTGWQKTTLHSSRWVTLCKTYDPMLRYMIYILDALPCLLIILSKYPCIFKSMSFSVDMDTNWQSHEFCRGCWRAYRSKFPDRTRAVLGSPLLFPLKTSLGLRHSLPRA